MFSQTFQYFKCQVQTRKLWIRIFEELHDPQALAVVIEPTVSAHTFGEHLFSGVAKRRMAQVMGECNCFREVFVQSQCTRDCAADGGHLDRMSQPGAQMVTGPIQEDLRFVLEPAKGPRMNDACAISLKFCAIRMAGLWIFSAARIARSLGKRRNRGALRRFHFLARLVAVSMFAGPATDRKRGSDDRCLVVAIFTPRSFVNCRFWRLRFQILPQRPLRSARLECDDQQIEDRQEQRRHG